MNCVCVGPRQTCRVEMLLSWVFWYMWQINTQLLVLIC
uniref:Uncharacterized protein n=1 Tax=Setaria italica TaxID=4555 RepID=K4ANE5_SETIT